MAKSKPSRSMANAGKAQCVIEKANTDRFEASEELAISKKHTQKACCSGRNFPQVSYTISPEDKEMIAKLSISQTIKKNRVVSQSEVLRALIRLGAARENELEIE
jgi:hypothetical protein